MLKFYQNIDNFITVGSCQLLMKLNTNTVMQRYINNPLYFKERPTHMGLKRNL